MTEDRKDRFTARCARGPEDAEFRRRRTEVYPVIGHPMAGYSFCLAVSIRVPSKTARV